MHETKRTLVFVGVAVVSLLAAVFAAPTINDPLADMNLGTDFYPDFTDPTAASSLSVVVFNEDKAQRQQFVVENDNGYWRIPSHNNYPADAADRLANTAASLIGIKRDGFQSQSAANHASLGVVDPLDDDASKLKGRGDRLTLKDDKGNTLVDFIIGKKVEGREGYYYVRQADSNAVYVSKLDVDLSTKFADWVETDLLKLNRGEIQKVVIEDYSIDESTGTLKQADTSELTREKSTDPWTLAGLDEETQQLDTVKVNAMISALDDLRLIGVRPKPEGLSQELKLSQDAAPRTREVFNDLISRGFFATPDGLKSNEGEMIVTTNKGVDYVLRFGEIFTGSDLEIEAGIERDEKAAKAEAAEKEQADGEKPDGEGDEEIAVDDEKQGRFLFAFARLNLDALGPKPTEPEKPAETPTAEDPPADATPKDDQAADEKKEETGDDQPADDADAEKTADEKTTDEKPAEDKPDPQAEYEKALAQYKTDLADYEKKVEEAKKQVAELNRRFADWYYVISEESFKKLRPHREELVKAKDAESQEEGGLPLDGNIPGLNLPTGD